MHYILIDFDCAVDAAADVGYDGVVPYCHWWQILVVLWVVHRLQVEIF